MKKSKLFRGIMFTLLPGLLFWLIFFIIFPKTVLFIFGIIFLACLILAIYERWRDQRHNSRPYVTLYLPTYSALGKIRVYLN